MGGTLAVTLRLPDGTEHRMARWTNPTPWFVNNMRFVNKDPKHIDTWMKEWNVMRADWEKHLPELKAAQAKYGDKAWDHIKFGCNMTPCYAGHNVLAPAGYGLVVLDMKENVILSCQGYTSYGIIHCPGVGMSLTKNGSIPQNPKEAQIQYCGDISLDELDSVRLWEFWREKRLKGVEVWGGKKKGVYTVPLTDQTIDIVLAYSVRNHGELFHKAGVDPIHYVLDMAPFTIIDLRDNDKQEGPDEFAEFRKKVIDLGFKLTDEEEKLWAEWIAEKKAEYEE